MRRFALVALMIVVSFLFFGMTIMHPIGKPILQDMDNYFITHAQEETGANNVVTSIVFDYRGFDTLGEATVLFAAVSGVAMLFGRRIRA
ncbi:MAG: hypothetical protein J7K68_02805 [Candidatus Diapherotrites archaeon]|nr:hypothetical protein [Candidatus Diapherotrites archaeon]